MGNGRWQRLADLLRDAAQGDEVGPSIARVASELLGVDDVSLTFVVAGVPTSTVGSSDAAVALCRRQFTLGEGPSVVAMRTGEPSLMADLTAGAAATPLLVEDPAARDVGAVFAFPLRVGGALVGVMTAHRAAPGPLSAAEHTDALILTTIATVALLQAEAGASLGRVEVAFDPIPEATAALHDDVQIAAGMTSEQLGVTIVEALIRMRAHAFAEDRPLEDVARAIVARTLRLER